jgi:hypothetical protein
MVGPTCAALDHAAPHAAARHPPRPLAPLHTNLHLALPQPLPLPLDSRRRVSPLGGPTPGTPSATYGLFADSGGDGLPPGCSVLELKSRLEAYGPRQRGRRHGHHVPDLPIRRGRRGCHCPRPSTPDVGITIGSKKVMGQQMALSDVFD